MITDKEKALELTISQIEKHFGKGSIMKLGVAAVGFTAGLTMTLAGLLGAAGLSVFASAWV